MRVRTGVDTVVALIVGVWALPSGAWATACFYERVGYWLGAQLGWWSQPAHYSLAPVWWDPGALWPTYFTRGAPVASPSWWPGSGPELALLHTYSFWLGGELAALVLILVAPVLAGFLAYGVILGLGGTRRRKREYV